jgi:AbiV family abortive infection protein
MRPRAFGDLSQLTPLRRRTALSDGLEMIYEHMASLESDAADLAARGRTRGANVLRILAEEEAAKFLIVLDAVRCDPEDTARWSRQITRCGDHLAKGIYARLTWYRPASYAEVLALIEPLRCSHYLDGPNDIDWVFRNELIANREDQLYVDYGQWDSGPGWTSPARYDRVHASDSPDPATQLVMALYDVGAASREGVSILARNWVGWNPDLDTSWREFGQRAESTLGELEARSGITDERLQCCRRLIVDSWTFPLHGADLSQIRVDVTDLRQQQAGYVHDLGRG